MVRKGASSTAAFGTSRRSSHDPGAFYARFPKPPTTKSSEVTPWLADSAIITGDSRSLTAVPDNSVALVVTSPPYLAGKEYELDVTAGHVPETFAEHLTMLRDVFEECVRVLEPGGRIAVNVANLGRRPFRSFSSDIWHILQDQLGLLPHAEVIWRKGKGMSGSATFGSFASPSSPAFRDTTERILIASKGSFLRQPKWQVRQKLGLPFESTISPEAFLEYTIDVWEFPPERASRVNHPAPFPVELPRRLIDLYTFKGDWVLDPFMGSGTTAVAALLTGRRWFGVDADPGYVEAANRRVEQVRSTGADAGVKGRAGPRGRGRHVS